MAVVERETAGLSLGRVGVLAALSMELGPFRGKGESRRDQGVSLSEQRVPGFEGEVLVGLSGVGKVAAAHATSVLVQAGIDTLLVVGTCGGLRVGTEVGRMIHANVALQWDLAVRSGHRLGAHQALREHWQAVAPGAQGPFLTADRPAIRLIERARRARGIWRAATRGSRAPGSATGPAAGPCTEAEHPVADMETAAAAAVAASAGLPWAALRVVSDERLGLLASLSAARRRKAGFAANAPALAHLPAATVPDLLRSLARANPGS